MKDTNSYQGIVSAHPKGFGFATTETGDEHFIAPPLMRELMPGDQIRFELEAGKKPGAMQVCRAQTLKRPDSVWQGTLRHENGSWLLEPDEPCFVRIQVQNLQFATEGDVVSVRVKGFTSNSGQRSSYVLATLERLLGARSRPGFDADYALARYDFEPYFSREVNAVCRDLPTTVSIDGRRDLTALPYVTIDGESTRDFDDAVYGKELDDGWLLSIAIADVSHYVTPGSNLDRAAQRRATSVYLPGKTVPMLPEALSNGLCSLVPGQTRLVVIVDVYTDRQAKVKRIEHYRAAIRSAQRLTYDEVNAWMDNKFAVGAPVEDSLKVLQDAYRALAKLREERGQLEFDDREPKLQYQEDGSVSLGWSVRNDAHKLVEELMLLANQCVASKLDPAQSRALFRHQPMPEGEDWERVTLWAQSRGLSLPEAPSMRALADLVSQASAGDVLKAELQVRNGMQPAVYDQSLASHFSLGYETYTHFTSPIRRYADLLVHRLLLGEARYGETEREALAGHCSKRSRDARMAERLVWDKLKKRNMAKNVQPGEDLAGHVVSQSRRGLRAVVDRWQCSVLLSAEELLDTGYVWNDDKEAWLQGQVVLEPGSLLSLRLTRLEEDKAKTELHAELV